MLKKHRGFYILKTLKDKGVLKGQTCKEIEKDIIKFLDEGPDNDPDTLRVVKS